jgi:hypothetical protein
MPLIKTVQQTLVTDDVLLWSLMRFVQWTNAIIGQANLPLYVIIAPLETLIICHRRIYRLSCFPYENGGGGTVQPTIFSFVLQTHIPMLTLWNARRLRRTVEATARFANVVFVKHDRPPRCHFASIDRNSQ